MSKNKKKILIVEDESIVKAIELKFQNAGFETDIAKDGLIAMEKLRGYDPDLILLDILLPRMDGYEVLKRIRADERTKDIPVLVFSNFSDQPFIDKVKELGVIGYIIKAHAKLEDLVGEVRRYFSKI